MPKIKAPKTSGPASLGGAQIGQPGGAFDLGSLLIVTSLALAIACLSIAVIPARAVRWRPAAIFVSERQVDLTVLGFALFMAGVFTLFWTNGP